MKYISFVVLLIFIGCDNNSNNNLNILNNPLQCYQWSLYKNQDFYIQHNIDNNASINHKQNINKYTGKGIKIVVIDDGLDTNHEDLKNAILDTWDLTTKSSNVFHDFSNEYHGTAVVGIIASRDNNTGIRGLAPQSKIIFLKHKQNMSDSETLEILEKANSYNPDIINCSWGTYNVSQSVRDKIQNMAINGRDGKGIIFVWAVGNNQRDIQNDESSIPEVIAVGSTNKNNDRAYYSNYGDELDILAPGGDYDLGITTLDDMGNNGIGVIEKNYILPTNANTFDGTSASAPIVSAIVAILLEINPIITREEIQTILRNSTDKIGDVIYQNNHNIYYGYGKINLSKAIDNVTNY